MLIGELPLLVLMLGSAVSAIVHPLVGLPIGFLVRSLGSSLDYFNRRLLGAASVFLAGYPLIQGLWHSPVNLLWWVIPSLGLVV